MWAEQTGHVRPLQQAGCEAFAWAKGVFATDIFAHGLRSRREKEVYVEESRVTDSSMFSLCLVEMKLCLQPLPRGERHQEVWEPLSLFPLWTVL